MNLIKKKCLPCEDKKTKGLSTEEISDLLMQVPGWTLSSKGDVLSREFKFSSFSNAIDFVSNVAKISDREGHHPDLHVFYDTVRVDLTTHSIKALTQNDFVLAAKIDTVIR